MTNSLSLLFFNMIDFNYNFKIFNLKNYISVVLFHYVVTLFFLKDFIYKFYLIFLITNLFRDLM